MVSLQKKAFREGNYTSWASLGLIELSPNPRDQDYIAALLDCINEILYIAYRDNQAGVNNRMATYQLPGLTLIGNSINHADSQYNAASGTGHGLYLTRGTYMNASFTGQYILQTYGWNTMFVYKKGVLIDTITTTAFNDAFYISPDAHYIVVADSVSPYKIEVLEGS